MAENGRNAVPGKMNRWSEANFLERLMSPSSRQNIDKKNPCPDSELLTAFSENRVDGFVLGAVAAHLIQCPDCAELHHRLLNLTKADLQADAPEWPNAEKRFDNWMNAYLRDHPSAVESGTQSKQLITAADPGTVWSFRSWRIGWAVGVVAALALVAASIFFLNRSLPSHSQPEVVAQTAPSSITLAPTPSTQGTAEPPLENSLKTGTPAPEKETPPNIHNSATKPKSHAVPTGVASSSQNAARRKESLKPSRDALNSPAVPPETPETESAAEPSVLAEPPAGATATASAPSDSSSNAILSSKASVNASKGFVAVAKSTTPPASGLPALISLEYSTSMWIQLSSDAPTADGTFPFRGTLLKPVDLPAGVPFDSETRVDGLGAVNDGRISLSIRGFFFRGTRYKLKTGSGVARVEPFNGGKTLEIWIDEDSAYERVPRGTASR
jgi:hypothetical protein